MNIDGLIDFNKYTLAVAAGCFVYAIEKIPPVGAGMPWLLLASTLCLLAAASVLGVLVFFVATSAAHHQAKHKVIPSAHLDWIRRFGISHAVALMAGVLLLVAMLAPKVLSAREPDAACPPASVIYFR